jgi:histidine ammonia-lyase
LAEVVRIGGGDPLPWDAYASVVYGNASVELAPDNRIDEHRAALERLVAGSAVIYAVNTGYGSDAARVIPGEAIERVQLNTLRSHAVGSGDAAAEPIVRGQMLLKARAYAEGPPALRRVVVEALVSALNDRVYPVIPLQGSQSASGDLIPNAHLGLVLAGEGEVFAGGERVPGARSGLTPITPAMKEGVGLTNDCSFATALAVDAVRGAAALVETSEGVAAMTLQGLRGYPDAFDERLLRCRPHPGALATGVHLRELLEGSALLRAPGRPHDPYSLRCIPQVHGAVRDAIAYARRACEIELSSVGDNPLIFADDAIAISGGNFHGEPIAIPLDTVTIAVCELASLSQRRTHHLVNCAFEIGLPEKLAVAPEESFGFLLLNTSAAALVSELRGLTMPSSIESIGVDPMEDHVSMASVSARRAQDAVELARRVVAIELACAAQALDFQGAARASGPTRALHEAVRARLPFLQHDEPIVSERLVELL